MHEDFYPNLSKQRECFKGVLAGNQTKADLKKHPSNADWPYELGPKGDVPEAAYKLWLEDVVNPDTQEFYLAKDEKTDLPLKGTEPKYKIVTICRVKRKSVEEVLYSKGYVKGHDINGNEKELSISFPERWIKTNFKFETVYDQRRKGMVKQCLGPSTTEEIYELKFNEKNLKSLIEGSSKLIK
jgi:hypothetical protein